MKSVLSHSAVLFLAVLLVTPSFAQSGGADVYKAKCLMCHGPDGTASTPVGKSLKAASFKDPSVVGVPDADLIAIVNKGKLKMPSYQGKLSDPQIKSVVSYIRTLQK